MRATRERQVPSKSAAGAKTRPRPEAEFQSARPGGRKLSLGLRSGGEGRELGLVWLRTVATQPHNGSIRCAQLRVALTDVSP